MKKVLSVFLFLFSFFLMRSQFTPTYTGKPIYQIITKRAGVTLGNIKVELFPNIAYYHTRNFDSLVNVHFYDTTAFHRAIPNFMIQGGDPNSRHGAISTWGFGQAGQPTVNAEFTVAKHLRGRLSAARSSNINSATSQFFICVANNPNLDGNYSVYGQVISGLNFADTIALCPKMTNYTNTPIQKVEMFITRIGSNDSIPNTPILLSPPSGTVNIDTTVSTQLKWNPVNGAVFYHLDVSTDSMFVWDVIRSVNLTSLSYYLNNLNSSTEYFWRITANNGGRSSQSQVWRLNTRSIGFNSNLNTHNLINPQIIVYPNPSKGIFSFLNLEKGNQILIYNINGKLIKELKINESTLNIDMTGNSQGNYIYKIFKNKTELKSGTLIVN